MDKILTIIIPTYNMERYLRYCLDSLVIRQELQAEVEVLVVNDGSVDASLSIAKEYEKAYPQMFKVIDKENGNYGSCVNVGLAAGTGKYVKVLDADDSVDTERFERFVSFLLENDADLVLSDFAVVDTDRKVRKIIRYDLGLNNPFTMDEVCDMPKFQNMQMHAVTYRRENFLKLKYRQTEGISYTDQQWIFLPMITVRTIVRFEDYVYKYLVGRSGQTMEPVFKLKNMLYVIRCAEDMASMYENHKAQVEGKPIQRYLYQRMIPFLKGAYVTALTHYDVETRQALRDYDNELKRRSAEVYELIGSKEVSSFLGFEYRRYWRNHKSANMLVIKLLSKMYNALLKFKQSFHKPDEMAVPVSF